ncbi:unnamed protein product [Diamesa hyperborea]
MMPYTSAMDFSTYQHRAEFAPMITTMGMPVGSSSSLTHSCILELRKEKSRDAARSRRGKENYEFYELAKMLPLPSAITSQLDKASIIRLTISFLKLRDFTGHGDPEWNREIKSTSMKSNSTRRTAEGLALELFEKHEGTHILQSLDGFALSVAADGRFLYISETVSIYLGLSQVEMTGSSIFEYIHHADHAEVAEQLGLTLSSYTGMTSPSPSSSDDISGTMNPDGEKIKQHTLFCCIDKNFTLVSSQMSLIASNYNGLERAFCIRMKSTLTKRGCHFKSSGYRVVLLICHLRPQHSFTSNKKSQPPLLGMVALAIALPSPSVHEIRLECDMFVTRINFDFRISHCEPKIKELLDYSPDELTGESLYTLCHGDDASKLRKCHMDLINKGQVLTHYYRMMNKNGGYTWIQTCATVVSSAKNPEEQNIICVNYVVSGKENCNLIMDHCQLGIIKNEPSMSLKNNNESMILEQKKTLNKATNLNESESQTNIDNKNNVTYLSGISCNEKSNSDEQVPPSVQINKRGRKRKSKSETKLDSVPQIPPLNTFNNTEHSNDYSEHKIPRPSPKSMIEHNTNKSEFSSNLLLSLQHHDGSFQEQSLAPMPATALLRKLYANRESVIHPTIRPTLYSEVMHQPSLAPTPPNDSYDSQFMHPRLYNGYSSKEFNNSMTPPSSVSPKDLTNHKPYGNYEYTNLSTSTSSSGDHYQKDQKELIPQLQLKHQPYAPHEIDPGYNIEHQSQYIQYHSGFHLYHKGIYPPH